MSTTGRVLGWMMLVFAALLLTLRGLAPGGGEQAIAASILISTLWLGFFALNRKPSEE